MGSQIGCDWATNTFTAFNIALYDPLKYLPMTGHLSSKLSSEAIFLEVR